MSANNDTKLTVAALMMAINSKPKHQQVLLYSDQGSTYKAKDYLDLFEKNNITQSMSRKGTYHDNAVAESFFNTIKTELIAQKTYQTREQARNAIFEYIEVFYNKVRSHSYLNYKSPDVFEKVFS